MLILSLLLACAVELTDTTDTGPAPSCIYDADGDGYALEDGDCNDSDPAIYPGAEEVCDLIDNNCDGVVDEDWPRTTLTCY